MVGLEWYPCCSLLQPVGLEVIYEALLPWSFFHPLPVMLISSHKNQSVLEMNYISVFGVQITCRNNKIFSLIYKLIMNCIGEYCAGDKIEKNEMGWACGAYG